MVVAQPCEGSLHDPTPWQDGEANPSLWSANDNRAQTLAVFSAHSTSRLAYAPSAHARANRGKQSFNPLSTNWPPLQSCTLVPVTATARIRGCLKSPDSRQILSSICSLQLPHSWMKPIPHSVNLELAELFKHPLKGGIFMFVIISTKALEIQEALMHSTHASAKKNRRRDQSPPSPSND
jgi:hypothetical protein